MHIKSLSRVPGRINFFVDGLTESTMPDTFYFDLSVMARLEILEKFFFGEEK